MPPNVESGVYYRTPAWHNLGTVIQKRIKIDDIPTYVPEIGAEVIKVPIPLTLPTGEFVVFDDKMATVRSGFHLPPSQTYPEGLYVEPVPLGTVGSEYVVHQALDCFRFLDDVIDDSDAIVEASFTLNGGKQVVLVLKLPQTITVADDTINTFLTAFTSFDGSLPTTIIPTKVRVECENMLMMARMGATTKWEIKHTKHSQAKFRLEDARKTLNMTYAHDAAFYEQAARMADRAFSDADFDAFLNSLVPLTKPDGKAKEGRGLTVAENKQSEIRGIYYGAENLGPIRGTVWGAYNSVTEYASHVQRGRETERSTLNENRFKRLIDPPKNDITQEAFNLLVEAV